MMSKKMVNKTTIYGKNTWHSLIKHLKKKHFSFNAFINNQVLKEKKVNFLIGTTTGQNSERMPSSGGKSSDAGQRI